MASDDEVKLEMIEDEDDAGGMYLNITYVNTTLHYAAMFTAIKLTIFR